ncbi:hypothetical protein BC629DRAFT_998646 [Irpex lacteus]|nr:hypothetical protein BC629DRAFT_998646 [Irpex lacteus]
MLSITFKDVCKTNAINTLSPATRQRRAARDMYSQADFAAETVFGVYGYTFQGHRPYTKLNLLILATTSR